MSTKAVERVPACSSGHQPAGFTQADHLHHARRLALAQGALQSLAEAAEAAYGYGSSEHQLADEALTKLRFLQGALDQTGREEHGLAWRWVYLTAPRGTQ